MADLSDKQFWRELERLEAEVRARIEAATADLPDGSPRAIRRRVERAGRDRFFFYSHYLPHLFPDPFTEHHHRLAERLDAEQFLIVLAFRGWGKSTMVTHAETLRELLVGATTFTVMTGRADEQTYPLVLQLRLEFEHNKRLIQDFGFLGGGAVWQMNHFVLSNGKEVLGRTLKGSTRGPRSLKNQRPDLWTLDDLQEKKDAKNPEIINATVDYIVSSVRPAMNPRRRKVRVIGTRISEDCALTKLQREKKWPAFELPALDKQGRPADPARFPAEHLEAERLGMGTDEFNLEYMLIAAGKTGMVRREWIKYYRREQIVDLPLICGMFEDPATSADSDYKAIGSVGYHLESNRYFVLRAFISQDASPEECAAECYRQWGTINRPPLRRAACGFEANGFQELIVYPMEQHRKAHGLAAMPLQPVTNTINKEIRVRGLVPLIEFGHLYFIAGDSDQDLLVDQLVFWPKLKRDGPDMLRGCIDQIGRLIQPKTAIHSGGSRRAPSLLAGYMP